MTKQDLFQSVEQSQPLFTQGRMIAQNATKGGSSGQKAKAAGNLLLDLDHAQVPFGQIIGPSRQLPRLPLWRKEISQ
jgi:hypothetical protein